MTLREVLSRLRDERIDISKGFFGLLETAINHLENGPESGGRMDVRSLSAPVVRKFMRRLVDTGRSVATANNYRAAILYLWKAAEGLDGVQPCPHSEIRKFREPERAPTAWRESQLASLVSACRNAPTKRGWGPKHWEALVMTIYDTSLRIGCLMNSKLSQLCEAESKLLVPGELQKGRKDTWQSLHPDTTRMLVNLWRPAGDDRLFPWPFHKDVIWRQLSRLILRPAGLPSTRRDKFHRIRRTSYTYVAKAYGIAAASRHAAHRGDLSNRYLDRTLLDEPDPLGALPRPTGMNHMNQPPLPPR